MAVTNHFKLLLVAVIVALICNIEEMKCCSRSSTPKNKEVCAFRDGNIDGDLKELVGKTDTEQECAKTIIRENAIRQWASNGKPIGASWRTTDQSCRAEFSQNTIFKSSTNRYCLLDVDYKILKGKHCGGEEIRSWNDGSDSNYGEQIGLPECKQLCNDHSECAGFVHNTNKNICGYWKKGPLSPYLKENRNCHRKLDGVEWVEETPDSYCDNAGNKNQKIYDQLSCQKLCEEDSGCVGINWREYQDSSCYLCQDDILRLGHGISGYGFYRKPLATATCSDACKNNNLCTATDTCTCGGLPACTGTEMCDEMNCVTPTCSDPCTNNNLCTATDTCTCGGGTACTGTETCDEINCEVEAVDCVWGEYAEWSICSATCIGGTRTRTRLEATPASNEGDECSGSATDTEDCNSDVECPITIDE